MSRIATLPSRAALLALALLVPACGVGGGGTLTPTIAPGIPTGLQALAGNRRITLEWTPVAPNVSYTVLRSLTSGGPYFAISVPAQFGSATSYVDTGLLNGTGYFYVVTAANQFGQSAPSSEAKGTPGFKPVFVGTGAMAMHTLAVLPDRTVWAWGSNSSAQLGNGNLTGRRDVPEQVPGVTDASAVAAGGGHSLALLRDGTLRSWGLNDAGQLGLGNLAGPVPDAQQIPNLVDLVAIAAGNAHSLALRNDGTVWTWGDNNFAQLGTGPAGPTPAHTPGQVPGLSGVLAIAAGSNHNLALRSDGTVWAWGVNQQAQLGNGTTSAPINVPARISNLTDVVAISAGLSHGMALNSDGRVFVWGSNSSGQLGNGSPTGIAPSAPVQVSTVTDAIAIVSGALHCLAIRSDSSVWSWGDNNFGELGTGTFSPAPVTSPVQVGGLADIGSIGAGQSHSLATRVDGTLRAWGNNTEGQIGNGMGPSRDSPAKVVNVTDVTAIATSSQRTLALRSSGGVLEWGASLSALTQVSSPTPVPGLSTLTTAVSAGFDHNLALRSSGAVWAWGPNNRGQLGQGGALPGGSSMPVQVTVLTGITQVDAGTQHSLALKGDGSVWAWGDNQVGQLGNGTSSPTAVTTPFQIPGLAGMSAVSAGSGFSLALRNDGTVWAWGTNGSGQLGDGTTAPNPSPAQVLNLTGITAISTGQSFCLALKNDGTAWAWGDSQYGQLGDGNAPGVPTPVPTPVQVLTLASVTALSAGNTHGLALKGDGTVWSWGRNDRGQLGTGDETGSSLPVQVSPFTDAFAISAGQFDFSYAVTQDGSCWSWGANDFFQLGAPYLPRVLTPATITQ